MGNSILSWRRVRALCVKETRQIVRDPSSWLIAVVIPLLLLFIFGYGKHGIWYTDLPAALDVIQRHHLQLVGPSPSRSSTTCANRCRAATGPSVRGFRRSVPWPNGSA